MCDEGSSRSTEALTTSASLIGLPKCDHSAVITFCEEVISEVRLKILGRLVFSHSYFSYSRMEAFRNATMSCAPHGILALLKKDEYGDQSTDAFAKDFAKKFAVCDSMLNAALGLYILINEVIKRELQNSNRGKTRYDAQNEVREMLREVIDMVEVQLKAMLSRDADELTQGRVIFSSDLYEESETEFCCETMQDYDWEKNLKKDKRKSLTKHKQERKTNEDKWMAKMRTMENNAAKRRK